MLSGRRASLYSPLLFDPGTHWQYGISTDWLGQVVEVVSGQGLDAYLAEHVFGPLGMADTTFSPGAEQRSRMMPVHARTDDGALVLSGFELPAAPEVWLAGTSSYGTARDYGRFLSVQPIPHAGVLPLAQPPPGGVPGPAAQLLGQVPPPAAGVEHEQDPLEGGPVIDPRSPSRTPRRWPRRDQRLDQFPEPILDQPLLLALGHDRRRSTISRPRSRSDTPGFETRS